MFAAEKGGGGAGAWGLKKADLSAPMGARGEGSECGAEWPQRGV